MPNNIKQLCNMHQINTKNVVEWDSDYEEIEDFCFTSNFKY